MPLWQWLLDIVALILVLIVAYGLALVIRRRALTRNGGTFELSHRARSAETGRGWILGLGRCSGESLEWFRIFSLSPRPSMTWSRESLVYTGRREGAESERMSLYAEHVIVVLETERGPIEFALSPRALMGFQAWLEAVPPGADWNQRRPRL